MARQRFCPSGFGLLRLAERETCPCSAAQVCGQAAQAFPVGGGRGSPGVGHSPGRPCGRWPRSVFSGTPSRRAACCACRAGLWRGLLPLEGQEEETSCGHCGAARAAAGPARRPSPRTPCGTPSRPSPRSSQEGTRARPTNPRRPYKAGKESSSVTESCGLIATFALL